MKARQFFSEMIRGTYAHLDAIKSSYEVMKEGDLQSILQNGKIIMSHSIEGPSFESFYIDNNMLTLESFYDLDVEGNTVRNEIAFKKYMN